MTFRDVRATWLTLALCGSAVLPACGSCNAHLDEPLAAEGDGCTHGTAEERFTCRVHARFSQMLPEQDISQTGSLSLKVTGNEDTELQLNLDNLWADCRFSPADCETNLARTINSIEENLGSMDVPMDAAQLRAALKPLEWVHSVQQAMAGAERPTRLITRPFVADMAVVYMQDMPDSMRMISDSDLGELDMTADQLHERALGNVGEHHGTFPTEPWEGAPEVRVLNAGDSYECSRVLLHDRWAQIRDQVGGDLLVSVPARDYVLYAGASSEVDLRRATVAFSELGHPISTAILHYTDDGWEQLP